MEGGGGKVNRLTERFGLRRDFTWRNRATAEDGRMVSFVEALELLLKWVPLTGTERCRLENASGRVLREALKADRDFPAFDRVMMDGHALRIADWESGTRSFRLTGSAPAGRAVVALDDAVGSCVEVMTGAPCPTGADCIIPVEEVQANEHGWIRYPDSAEPAARRFIHAAGSDAAAGQVLLEPGTLMGSREVGVAASCGAAWLEVSKVPRIAVVATGDELVAVEETPAAHQIRQSNAHAITCGLIRGGYPPMHTGVLKDDLSVAGPAMRVLLAAHDWLILTGAVSMGARDFIPTVLRDLGCREIFHGVAQRPGKPAGFWIGPAGQVIMALPGNPVSALTGLHTFVMPALTVASGRPRPVARRVLMDERGAALKGLTRHLPVTLRADGRAEPAATGNSGDFIGLLRSDGFLTLPPSGEGNTRAAAFPFTPWL
jgi:molybdopterin molybdotransferase